MSSKEKSQLSPDDSLDSLPGVGSSIAAEVAEFGVTCVADLLLLRPRRYENRAEIKNLSSIIEKGPVNTFVRILSKSLSRSDVPKIVVDDICDSQFSPGSKIRQATIWCFGRNYLDHILTEGSVYHLYGQAIRREEFASSLQISQFEIKKAHALNGQFTAKSFGMIIPHYSANSSINSKLASCVKKAFDLFDWEHFDFGLREDVREKFGVVSVHEAVRLMHWPKSADDVELSRRALSLMEIQRFRRESVFKPEVSPSVSVSDKEREFIASLPFKLTKSQRSAVLDVFSDLESGKESVRILQGEVGSGKTIVAFIGCVHEFYNGNQSVLVAPTEILARQHYLNALKIFTDLGVKVAFLSSSLSAAERRNITAKCKDGDIDLLIGTHSVISDSLDFKSLSFAVIDEEQRFGVQQKQKIRAKGSAVKILYMSATPIPSSILKIFSAQMECSVLEEIPSGRLPVKTFLVSQARRREAYDCIQSEFDKGHCAYFVVPRIEDGDGRELRSIESLEKELSRIFPGVSHALISSETKVSDKEKILVDFLSGSIKYLISTTVVEVGLDNSKATVILVEDADMFGISTLHQLRGRVGRSSLQSWCFLVYREDISESGKKRLRALKSTCNGFELSELDLEIRGGGDIFGTAQSGRQELIFFDFDKDQDFLA